MCVGGEGAVQGTAVFERKWMQISAGTISVLQNNASTSQVPFEHQTLLPAGILCSFNWTV